MPKPDEKPSEADFSAPDERGDASSVENVASLIQKWRIDDHDVTEVYGAVKNYGLDEISKLEGILKILYMRCFQDWHFAKHAAKVSSEIVASSNSGAVFRASLLRLIQSDFKGKK